MLLLARDEAYDVLSAFAVAPATTRLRVTHSWIQLGRADGLPRPSAINLDAIQVIRPEQVDTFIARLTPEKLAEVDRAIHFLASEQAGYVSGAVIPVRMLSSMLSAMVNIVPSRMTMSTNQRKPSTAIGPGRGTYVAFRSEPAG